MSRTFDWFGILNVNKPAGWTSRQAVDHVKRLVKPAKVGHAGTLDPLATGVLILCLGPATRLVPYVHDLRKAYRAEFQLGCRSATDDIESDVEVIGDAPRVSRDQIEAALPRFVGPIAQVPPVYSAVKIRGRRAYELARKGRSVPLKPRTVEIDSLQVIEYAYPQLTLEVTCGTGTYIRSLGRDLSESLGTGAVMNALSRRRVGPYTLQNSVSPQEITAESISRLVHPAQTCLSGMPAMRATPEAIDLVQRGLRIDCPDSLDASDGHEVIVESPSGRLTAIAEIVGTELQPRYVFRSD